MYQQQSASLRPGWRGAITLEVSTRPEDWGNGALQNKAQLTSIANGFVRFSRMWLTARGYSPVSFRAVDGYQKLGSYDWNGDNSQTRIRRLILQDFYSPENYGKPMSQWRGLGGAPNITVLPKAYGNYGH